MLYVIFDTETTGRKPETNDVIQIAYMVLDDDRNVIDADSVYLNTDLIIEQGAYNVHHIDKAFLEENAGSYFLSDFIMSNPYFNGEVEDITYIAYNAYFDITSINTSLVRRGYPLVKFGSEVKSLNQTSGRHNLCLMKYSQRYLGRSRWPKLSDTRQCILGEDCENIIQDFIKQICGVFNIDIKKDSAAHDALYDTAVTAFLFNVYKEQER